MVAVTLYVARELPSLRREAACRRRRPERQSRLRYGRVQIAGELRWAEMEDTTPDTERSSSACSISRLCLVALTRWHCPDCSAPTRRPAISTHLTGLCPRRRFVSPCGEPGSCRARTSDPGVSVCRVHDRLTGTRHGWYTRHGRAVCNPRLRRLQTFPLFVHGWSVTRADAQCQP